MQIDTNTQAIETSGLGAAGSFSIKRSAAAFQMLSSGLYSNKIRAVVRELTSNAVDAHTMVNRKDLPIEVKLPNQIDSQFYVKDFGPGLSHDDIMHMYTTYFDSTKQSSNDFIGGFGVGSKSPFAYTDAFTVESRHGGMRNLYSSFISEDGTPQIAQIGSFPLEDGESTGLTVSMPVKPNDYSSFEREAADLFRWFDVKPKWLGTARTVESPKMKEVSPGIFWRSANEYGQNILVRMGQVVYSVDKYSANASVEVQKAMQALLRFKPLLDVPIGRMSVAASREEVAYDKKTKDYLDERLPEAYALAMREVVNTLQAMDLKQHDGRREAYDFLHSYNLQNFFSEAKVDELIAAKRAVPDLNMLLRDQGVSADQFLPILQGLEAPTKEQRQVVDVAMPYTKDRIENWMGSHIGQPWDTNAFNRPIKLMEIDMPVTNIYAERARKTWYAKTPSHAFKTIVFRRPAGVDEAAYIQTRDEMLATWGLGNVKITKLSQQLTAEDAIKYQKTQGTQSVPASTFFSGRPSICTSDLKSFYYVEQINGHLHVPPEGWDPSKFNKLVEEIQENVSVAKSFLKDAGADQATLSRVYTIQHEDIEKVKTFPGARNLLDVMVGALDNPQFRAKWEALPVQREKKNLTAAKLMSASNYSRDGAQIVQELQTTQLGQAMAWLKTIPEWTFGDNEKRPDGVQYVVLGGLLSDASKSPNPLPGKFMDAEFLNDRVKKYYPLVTSALHEYRYSSMSADEGMEIAKYVAWKDSLATAPFLEGVTTPPSPLPQESPTPTF